jgi:ubiquinone/menaquinone biosynthesis C-methylase UbiE
MGFHTFDPAKIERLEDPSRFRFCSREELLQYLPRDDDAIVIDLGSGSGYYTDELAAFLGQVVGVDVQPAMHARYRERGVPDNVRLVTADAGSLPLADGSLHGAFSTMTFHESTTEESLRELHRVFAPEASFVVVDWSNEGSGEAGPPVAERFSAAEARELLSDAGFSVESAAERSETFHLIASATA